MTTPQERNQALKDILAQRVLVIDGAMGTMIHAAPLSIETDYLGRENCPEILNVTRPDVIREIHGNILRRARTSSKPTPSAGRASRFWTTNWTTAATN